MRSSLGALPNYLLVVCEKPDAARRIASALGDGRPNVLPMGGLDAYSVQTAATHYVIAAASGHLYTLADPANRRRAYPVFDAAWLPRQLVEKKAAHVGRRIALFRQLSERASGFVNACDCDLEGETIGHNILRYACGGRERGAYRAKFSTLTVEELRAAFREAAPVANSHLAEAGRTRHAVDFLYGVNLSRALSEAVRHASQRYRTISIGRVQGPTLAFVVERETAIRTFVPTPYWTISALVRTQTDQLRLRYEQEKAGPRAKAFAVRSACEGQDGLVTQLEREVYSQSPPPPFNLGDLQQEAHRVFGYAPSVTATQAERLYLDALISYPRTDSQKLPRSINYPAILSNLSRLTQYCSQAEELRRGPLYPREGPKSDPAHPAIYPTGELPSRPLERGAADLYDLIVRRFLAVFGADALYERGRAEVTVSGYRFFARGRRVLRAGWVKYYQPYTTVEEAGLPPLAEGERLRFLRVEVTERMEQPPARYDSASLLARMEEDNIGTKATRGDVIRTLYARGYVGGERMVASQVAFAVVDTMTQHTPTIISSSLTRQMEAELERIAEGGEQSEAVIERALDQVMQSLSSIRSAELSVGAQLSAAARMVAFEQSHLGPCPVCRQGQLRMIRSQRTGKRFVGCTRYAEGCRASAPLPQRGTIRPTSRACRTCAWPIVYVRLGRFPWRLCVNPECPTKQGRRRARTQHAPLPVAARRGARA